ncbi:hypothetical protein STRIP9103_05201 [Streptomyces ipomoeae 91-03]|jgi:hypothetical protein|uniref:Uncharacterized protein n=1 Tax=Streptomyces ipomoeae 91-03 TaxID=698759 RepID=L1L5L3_9ACTN|nr:hypothetical protein STRIP9103_05201 [Streptomyces ipomoeae 91-03]
MVYLGAYGPMRSEEPAGLRRRDVDLDDLRIRSASLSRSG